MASLQRYKALGWWLVFFGCAWLSPLIAAESTIDDDLGEEEGEEQVLAAAPATSAGEVKFWEAMKWLHSKAPGDLAAGRAALEEAVAQEFTHAQLFLAECYQSGGYGYSRNAKKAAALVRLAAERGNAFAQVSYGMVLFSGIGVRKDEERAFEWLKAAVADEADYSRPFPPADFHAGTGELATELGVAGAAAVDPVASAKARAHFFLGMLLEKRNDGAGAQAQFVAAATAGVSGRDGVMQAAIQAAVNYALGRGVPRDSAKANEMLEQSRKLGRHAGISLLHNYATAKLVDDFAVSELEEAVAKASDEAEGEMQMNIARMFTDKKSKDYNPKEAVTWFELAAESGKPWAMLELAFLYTRGDLGKPEPEKAFGWFQRAMGEDEKKVKHYLAVANVVISLHNGIGVAADSAKAKALAEKHRESELVSELLLRGECPTKIVTFEEAVALNQRWATRQKDAHAQYLMGRRYLNGWGVKASAREAAKWFKRAVEQKHGAACRELGFLYESRWWALGDSEASGLKKAVEYYRRGVEAGDAIAAANLAYFYDNGRGVEVDEAEAERLYRRSIALKPDFARALNNLGSLHENRAAAARRAGDASAVKENEARMMELYEKAFDREESYAAHNLGRIYRAGVAGPPDLQKAYGYFEKAAEWGHTEARFKLGEMHEKGEGVPVTLVEAAYHYRLAALDGHLEALRRLTNFYLLGQGGAQDFERAQFWLIRMYRMGRAGALAVFADVTLRQGKYKEAVTVLKLLRDFDNPVLSGIGYQKLGVCYAAGWGVKANLVKARAYRDKAAELGNADAIFSQGRELMAEGKVGPAVDLFVKAAPGSGAASFALGQLHFYGREAEVTKDVTKAMRFLRQAAEQHHVEALYFLAGSTFNHLPEAPTLEEAIQFAQAAEAMGHPKAGALREKLENRRRTNLEAPGETTGVKTTQAGRTRISRIG